MAADAAADGMGAETRFDLHEPKVHHRARRKAPHLCLDESAQVAGRTMLHLEDRVQLIVELDHHARTQLCCSNHEREIISLAAEMGSNPFYCC